MTKPLDNLVQKEMSRKEFLLTLGFGMASIFGFSTLVHLLTGKHPSARLTGRSVGFGSGAYGGNTEASSKRKIG